MNSVTKSVTIVIVAIAAAACSMFDNQQSPSGYVRHCVRLLDTKALYADSPEWQAKKKEVLKEAKALTDMDEAHRLVGEAANIAGGKHSAIIPPVKDTASYPENAPEVKMLDGNVAYVLLPDHSGVKVSDSLYLHTVLNFLQAHTDAAGVILDLRDNRGGNMYPMIAAISPLLPDGVILRFKGRKKTSPVYLEFVTRSENLTSIRKFPESVPVAILTNEWTASSGEATLLCFRGLPNVRTFGIPTAGYASANIPYNLSDGYRLVVTTSCDMARTGEVFCDDPIAPDVLSENPIEDAVAWMLDL